MWNPFKQKAIPHPDGAGYFYTQGAKFDPGAEGFALETVNLMPLQSLAGAGQNVNQLQTLAPNLFQDLTPVVQPFAAGIGVESLQLAMLNDTSVIAPDLTQS